MYKDINENEPIYQISIAARLLGISVHTLRMYEREGLFVPFKKESGQRLFSKVDLERINCIRKAISESKISINGIKTIYSLIPCWDIIKCAEEDRNNCKAFIGHSEPCWSYKHPNTTCFDLECRTCEVYVRFGDCGSIKDKIKEITINNNSSNKDIE